MKGVQKGVSFLFQQTVEIWWPQTDTLSLHSGLLIKSCCFCMFVFMSICVIFTFHFSFLLNHFLSKSGFLSTHATKNIMEKAFNSEPKVCIYVTSNHSLAVCDCMWCGTNNLFFLNLSYLICKMWIMISLPIPHSYCEIQAL